VGGGAQQNYTSQLPRQRVVTYKNFKKNLFFDLKSGKIYFRF
jgi:hypothetical protein